MGNEGKYVVQHWAEGPAMILMGMVLGSGLTVAGFVLAGWHP
jgi:hypothetical protein